MMKHPGFDNFDVGIIFYDQSLAREWGEICTYNFVNRFDWPNALRPEGNIVDEKTWSGIRHIANK